MAHQKKLKEDLRSVWNEWSTPHDWGLWQDNPKPTAVEEVLGGAAAPPKPDVGAEAGGAIEQAAVAPASPEPVQQGNSYGQGGGGSVESVAGHSRTSVGGGRAKVVGHLGPQKKNRVTGLQLGTAIIPRPPANAHPAGRGRSLSRTPSRQRVAPISPMRSPTAPAAAPVPAAAATSASAAPPAQQLADGVSRYNGLNGRPIYRKNGRIISASQAFE